MSPLGSLIFVLVLGFALVLLVWGMFQFVPTPRLQATKSFFCPFRERNVTAEFEETGWDGSAVNVARCSAFDPPTAIACEQGCLNLKRLPAARGAAV